MSSYRTPKSRKRKRTYDTASTRSVRRRMNFKPRLSFKRAAILNDMQRVSMIYGEVKTITFNDIAEGLNKFQVRANSCYDPGYAVDVADHQPRGWDELAALYERYAVINAKIQVTFVSETRVPFFYCISLRDGGATSTTIDDELEYGGARHRTVGKSISLSKADTVTITHSVNIKKFTGKDGKDDRNSALINNNPTNIVLFDIGVAPLVSLGATHSPVYITYKIIYDTLLMEPRNPGSS